MKPAEKEYGITITPTTEGEATTLYCDAGAKSHLAELGNAE